MDTQIKILSEDEIRKVHSATMEILGQAGMCIKSHKAFNALKLAGAKTDDENNIVYFTEKMVMEAVESAPKSYVLGARNPKYDFKVPAQEPRQIMSGITTNIYDPYTGEKRESLKSDVTNVGRIFQYADTGAVCWTGCSAADVPPETHTLHEMAAIIEGTSKHVQFQMNTPYEARYARKILDVVAGSQENFIKHNFASMAFCPVSPLTLDGEQVDAIMELMDYNIPVNIYSMPIIGMTSPASIFSTLCQVMAEILGTIVLFQTLKPGWPVMFGISCGLADHVSGAYVRGGEISLLSLAGTEMARYYGIPCTGTGGASYETLPAFLGRPDLLDGIGITDSSMTVSLELILTEDEVAKRCLRILKGINVDESTDLTKEIIAGGPGSAFLANRSTLKNFRNQDELYHSKLFPSSLRSTIDERRDSYGIANKRVREILEAEVVDPLDENVLECINQICSAADQGIEEK